MTGRSILLFAAAAVADETETDEAALRETSYLPREFEPDYRFDFHQAKPTHPAVSSQKAN